MADAAPRRGLRGAAIFVSPSRLRAFASFPALTRRREDAKKGDSTRQHRHACYLALTAEEANGVWWLPRSSKPLFRRGSVEGLVRFRRASASSKDVGMSGWSRPHHPLCQKSQDVRRLGCQAIPPGLQLPNVLTSLLVIPTAPAHRSKTPPSSLRPRAPRPSPPRPGRTAPDPRR